MADLSINLGKVFGIPIEMHWTFTLLLIITALISTVLFGFIILLFFLVVIHELAHSITSKRNGIRVKKIILIPLGGASIVDLTGVPPRVSFRIALAGPLMSITLAAVCGLLAIYLQPGPIQGTFQLLFEINLILGVFNLLPAFPLDGGRVLKSYLQEKMNQLEATKIAVKVSEATLVLFILGSIIYYSLVGGAASSLSNIAFVVIWDVIIALFVYGGAQAELQSAYVMKYTANLHVYNAVSKNFVMVTPETKMRAIYKILLKEGTHIVLFQKDKKSFILSSVPYSPLGHGGQGILDKKVSDLGVEIPKIDYSETLSRAIETMRYDDAAVAAVIKGERIVGVLLGQHVDSIVALHMPQAANKK